MRVLLAVDGSNYTEMCANAVKKIGLPDNTQITITTVIPEQTFLGGLYIGKLLTSREQQNKLHKSQEDSAQVLIDRVVSELHGAKFEVDKIIAWGKPDEEIVKVAHKDNFDLVVIGAKGIANSDRFQLGTVAHRIIKHVNCSVLLVKEQIKKIRRVLIATDGSKHSKAAEEFLLGLTLPKKTDVFIVTALQSQVDAFMKMPTLDIDTNRQIMADLHMAESKEAEKLIKDTESKFYSKGHEVTALIRQGEPATEILSCANTFNPEIVVVGAKGLSGIEGFLMGSVSKRVARFSKYSVIIVRPPKKI